MGHILEILKEVRRRPAMYLGIPSLSRLASFLRGYHCACQKLDPENADPLFRHLCVWILHRYRSRELSWEESILQESSDERDALERFWQLVDEYCAERQSNDRNLSNGT